MDKRLEAAVEIGVENGVSRESGPEQVEGAITELSIEYLSFMLGGEEYGIKVSGVREAIRPIEILEVPRVPEYVKGIISLRGMVIPVFDLKRRLGFTESPATLRTRVIVAAQSKNLYGLLVDSVVGVIPVFSNRVEIPPHGLRKGAEFVKGVVHYASREGRELDRFLILLNLEKVLTT